MLLNTLFAKYGLAKVVLISTLSVGTVGGIGTYAFTEINKDVEKQTTEQATMSLKISSAGVDDRSAATSLGSIFSFGSSDGQKTETCGKRQFTMKNPDTVPGQPALSVLLATNPCFSFAWVEKNDTVLINFVTVNTIDSQEMIKSAKVIRMVQGMNEVNETLNAFSLDMTEKLTGSRTVVQLEKMIEQNMKQSRGARGKLTDYDRNAMFWNLVQKVAREQGVRVRLSDADVERKVTYAQHKYQDTLKGYSKVMVRMAPGQWQLYRMELSFAHDQYEKNNNQRATEIAKKAYSRLAQPQEKQDAQNKIRKYFPKIYKQILST